MKTPEIVDVKGVLQYLLEHDHDDWRWLDRNRRATGSNDPFLCHRIEQMYVQRNLIGRALMRRACEFICEKIHPEQTLAGYNAEYGELIVGVESVFWPPIRRSYLVRWIGELHIEELGGDDDRPAGRNVGLGRMPAGEAVKGERR